jgi:tRNA(Ile)-lysidine synthase
MRAFSCFPHTPGGFAVAVSGGSDSMALLLLASDVRRASGARLAAVSVDHGLRAEAKDELEVVARACEALGVEHHVLHWRRNGDGQVGQDEARRARHALLAEWAARFGHARIALGHTRDDRLETFLMRARQGSGWYGLAGLLPESASPVWPEGRGLSLFRPLLAFGREELRAELRARNLGWIEDPSNAQDRFERVRMRRLLLRMDASAIQKTVRVMDRLLAMRAAVAKEAGSLLGRVEDGAGSADIPLEARGGVGGVGGEAWLRFVEAMVMAAGGARHPPRRDALDRLLARIASQDPLMARGVTLAGAKIRIRKKVFLSFAQAPPRRGRPAAEGPDWGRARALLDAPDLTSLSV